MKRILFIIAILAVFANTAQAIVGYLGAPRARFWNTAGTAPLSGGKVVTCSSGASCGCTSFTGKTSYTDSTGGTPNANPVVLDSRGEASIWLDGTYKIAVCTSANVLQWTMDGITGVQDQSVTLSEWNASGLTPTYISATSFSVAGDHTTDFFAVNRRLKTTNTAGTIYSTITASSFGASITTVTVINDSGSLDSGLSAVSVGLMDSANLSAPIPATVTKTDDYVMTAADVNKIFIFNKATAVAATLKAANLVPNGTWIRFKNIGAGTLTLTGTVDGASNPTLAQWETLVVFSNGSAWYKSGVANGIAGSGTVLHFKTVNIGDWNMDTTNNVSVAHGLTMSKIIAVTGMFRDDGDVSRYPITPGTITTPAEVEVNMTSMDATQISVLRKTGGTFDGNVNFDATSYNRGWITFWYTD